MRPLLSDIAVVLDLPGSPQTTWNWCTAVGDDIDAEGGRIHVLDRAVGPMDRRSIESLSRQLEQPQQQPQWQLQQQPQQQPQWQPQQPQQQQPQWQQQQSGPSGSHTALRQFLMSFIRQQDLVACATMLEGSQTSGGRGVDGATGTAASRAIIETGVGVEGAMTAPEAMATWAAGAEADTWSLVSGATGSALAQPSSPPAGLTMVHSS
ncbi:hypothetical protein Vafri_16549, partial [Volvox africanus]